MPDPGAMEVCSSTEMGAPGASHLGTGDRGPKTDRSRPRSVPVNALVLPETVNLETFVSNVVRWDADRSAPDVRRARIRVLGRRSVTQVLINAVVSMGRRNSQVKPNLY